MIQPSHNRQQMRPCQASTVDPEIFYTVDDFSHPHLTKQQRQVVNARRLRQAQRICGHCPLRDACLDDNLLEVHGTYAGKSPAQRAERALARGQRLQRLPLYDEVAVVRTMAGEPVETDAASRFEAFWRLDQRGATQGQIAELMGVEVRTVQNWRANQSRPRRRSDGAA